MDNERLLSHEERLNTYLGEYAEEIDIELNQSRIKSRTFGIEDIIDFDIEFFEEGPEAIDGLRVSSFVKVLCEKYVKVGEEKYLRQSMYRGAMFAVQVAKIIHGSTVNADTKAYLSQLNLCSDGYERLKSDVKDYLAENTQTQLLIEHYVGELDGGRGYMTHTAHAAGVMFMLCERNLAARQIAANADAASVYDFDEPT